jgi:hypothetical protein
VPDTEERTRESPESEVLYEVVVDGVFGAVAGFAGTVVLTGFLLASSLFGGFRFENFAATTEILLLDPYVGSLSAVAGYVIFVVGGSVVWPLMLASIGTYLPGDSFALKGAAFGLVVWPGFVLGFGSVLDAPTLGYASFVVLSFLGHAAYGYVMGDVFDRLYAADRPVVSRGATPVDLAAGPQTEATATERRPAGTDATTTETGGETAAETDATTTEAGGETAAETDATTTTGADEATGTDDPAPPTRAATAPDDLPPLLRFDQAIEKIDEAVGDEEHPQFEAFKREYEQLKRSPSNRQTLASDLRADLTGLAESLPDDRGIERWLDSMSGRLATYLKAGRTPSLTLDLVSVKLTKDGEPATAAELREETATATVTVLNQGERSGAVIRVSFYNEDDVLLRSDDLSMGYMDPGERKTLSTKVYVPSIAARYEATVLDPAEGQRFIEGL